MERIGSIKKLAGSRFLSLYEVDAIRRDGGHFPYYVASRKPTAEQLKAVTGRNDPDGVVICARLDDKMVLVRQFRYPIGGYVYELPAGLVEPGEDIAQAAAREMLEETGLTLTVTGTARPYYTTVGMTDESCATVFGTCAGTPTSQGQEATEDIQVVLADRQEAQRILEEENVAIMCAYQLMRFCSHFTDERE